MALGYFKTLVRDAEPAKDPYGAPGTGKSTMISIVTIIGILLAWWLATQFELVRPLFLPSPELVYAKFIKISCWNHYSESFLVFLGAAEHDHGKHQRATNEQPDCYPPVAEMLLRRVVHFASAGPARHSNFLRENPFLLEMRRQTLPLKFQDDLALL